MVCINLLVLAKRFPMFNKKIFFKILDLIIKFDNKISEKSLNMNEDFYM